MKKPSEQNSLKTPLKIAIFIATIAVVTAWWNYTILVTIILLLFSIVLLWLDSFRFTKSFIIAGLLGAIAEAIAITSNPWEYSSPHLFGVPVWLPVLWGIASTSFISISKYLGEIKVK